MNNFTARKLGEVLAFARIGNETIERGKTALASVLGNETVNALLEENKKHGSGIAAAVTLSGVREATETKAAGTGKKLRAMRDLYVGNEWDNPAELLEWLGFFEGAAIVHWKLVQGAARATSNIELTELAENGVALHQSLLLKISSAIETFAQTKAVESATPESLLAFGSTPTV